MTQEQWAEMRYFRANEFDQDSIPGSGIAMAYKFVKVLDEVRHRCAFPFPIISGVRTREWNDIVGGVDGSSHMVDQDGHAWACDIAIWSRVPGQVTYRRALMVGTAWELGIRRIGIAESFVHLDMDPTKPTPRIWTYPV